MYCRYSFSIFLVKIQNSVLFCQNRFLFLTIPAPPPSLALTLSLFLTFFLPLFTYEYNILPLVISLTVDPCWIFVLKEKHRSLPMLSNVIKTSISSSDLFVIELTLLANFFCYIASLLIR